MTVSVNYARLGHTMRIELEVLQAAAYMTARDGSFGVGGLAEQCSVSKSTIYRTLAKLIEIGWVSWRSKGVYRMTDHYFTPRALLEYSRAALEFEQDMSHKVGSEVISNG